MKIVLDTNCLLVSVQEYSDYFWLWQAFCDKKFVLCYTGEILNEYEEILSHYYSAGFAEYVIDAILSAPNTESVMLYFKWNLIAADPDDNKFVDCALNAGADFIITNDKHFNILKEIDFPKINTMDIEAFKKVMSMH